jgi:hypothetical protein
VFVFHDYVPIKRFVALVFEVRDLLQILVQTPFVVVGTDGGSWVECSSAKGSCDHVFNSLPSHRGIVTAGLDKSMLYIKVSPFGINYPETILTGLHREAVG